MTSARTRDRLVDRLRAEGIDHPLVLERLRQLPRHLFVDEALSSRAYEDTALPIGYGQTISQPYVVARMTAALIQGRESELPLNKFLEIGTGCGYQSAMLATFARRVVSLERIGQLARRARLLLRELRIHNVSVRHADGYAGVPAEGPYDGILAAAAPERVPLALLEQLADGGRLVLPAGAGRRQKLVCVTRHGDALEQTVLGPVSFVPMLEGVEA